VVAPEVVSAVGAVVVGVAVVVGAAVVVVVGASGVDAAVVVGVTVVVVVGASGAAESVAPPEHAETNNARTRNQAALRFMIRVCHPRRSGSQ
jgi:hypothetical protein